MFMAMLRLQSMLVGMSDEEYKPIHRASAKQPVVHQEIAAIHNEVSNIGVDLQKMRDPVVQGSLLHKLAEERENSNRILKTILETLDSRLAKMEERIGKMEERMRPSPKSPEPPKPDEFLLPSVDEEIVSCIRSKGTVCAEDVRTHFGYKGKNAASSRLNHLFELGVLEKRQAGRVVYYRMK